MSYPEDIIDEANERNPWKSQDAKEWYMEGRMYEREQVNRKPSDSGSES